MINSIEFIVISFAVINITGVVVYTTIKNAWEFSEYQKLQKQKRLEFEINYISCLESIADSSMIYNYFREIRKKLPENLHNIMLCKAIVNDFYARLYIDQIDLEGNCKLSDSPNRRKMLK